MNTLSVNGPAVDPGEMAARLEQFEIQLARDARDQALEQLQRGEQQMATLRGELLGQLNAKDQDLHRLADNAHRLVDGLEAEQLAGRKLQQLADKQRRELDDLGLKLQAATSRCQALEKDLKVLTALNPKRLREQNKRLQEKGREKQVRIDELTKINRQYRKDTQEIVKLRQQNQALELLLAEEAPPQWISKNGYWGVVLVQTAKDRPYSHAQIHDYKRDFSTFWTMKDGALVKISKIKVDVPQYAIAQALTMLKEIEG